MVEFHAARQFSSPFRRPASPSPDRDTPSRTPLKVASNRRCSSTQLTLPPPFRRHAELVFRTFHVFYLLLFQGIIRNAPFPVLKSSNSSLTPHPPSFSRSVAFRYAHAPRSAERDDYLHQVTRQARHTPSHRYPLSTEPSLVA